jgi:hypothetical protein
VCACVCVSIQMLDMFLTCIGCMFRRSVVVYTSSNSLGMEIFNIIKHHDTLVMLLHNKDAVNLSGA